MSRALIVGGSGGSGQAISHLCVHRGMHTIIHGGNREDVLDRLVADLQREGGSVEAFLFSGPIPELAKRLSSYRSVDVLCVCFGPYHEAALSDTRPEDWQNLIEANLLLPSLLLSYFAPEMARNGGGKIILFGFELPLLRKGYRRAAAYAASKVGIGSLVSSAAMEFGNKGVQIVALYPDFIDTEYLSDSRRDKWTQLSFHGTLLSKGDIASVVAWVLDAPMSVNGLLIPIRKWW